jgi:predicted ABC-type ATPase
VPTLTLVAAPNGSGKSTITASIAFEGLTSVVDPDAIARTIDAEQPSRAAIPAARQTALRCRSLLAIRQNFVLESTLAGHGALSLMRDAKRAGYRALLVYVALGDPELHIEGAYVFASRKVAMIYRRGCSAKVRPKSASRSRGDATG